MIAWIFDTETTGLVSNHTISLDKQSSVIEFYGCLVNLASGEKMDELECLIRPHEFPMTEKTIEETKTKLKNEMLENAAPFAAHAPLIREKIEAAPVIIAHNASFDKEMIDIEFERLKSSLKWPRGIICSVEQTIHLKGKRLTLTELHSFLLGTEFKDAHRARPDTEALVRCSLKLFEMGLL